MKKLFILLITAILMTSSFVSCNKTEAEAETVFRLADGKDGSAEFKALSEQFGKVASYEDAVAAVEAAVAFNDSASMIVFGDGKETVPVKSGEIVELSVDSINSDNYDEIQSVLYEHRKSVGNIIATALCEGLPEENQVHTDVTKMNSYFPPLICYIDAKDGGRDSIMFEAINGITDRIVYTDESAGKSYTLYPSEEFIELGSKCFEERIKADSEE